MKPADDAMDATHAPAPQHQTDESYIAIRSYLPCHDLHLDWGSRSIYREAGWVGAGILGRGKDRHERERRKRTKRWFKIYLLCHTASSMDMLCGRADRS
uniref:Uncharacterized protein n=1 Tax=Arundo donax TaxID=35708 RepID=A0A0A9H9V6_ARUDO